MPHIMVQIFFLENYYVAEKVWEERLCIMYRRVESAGWVDRQNANVQQFVHIHLVTHPNVTAVVH